MEFCTDIRIDLGAYGMDGKAIEMGLPTFRRKVEYRNEVGRMIRLTGDGTADNIPIGDMAILRVLKYINKAPFQITLAGFMAFCDKLDSVQVGAAERLFEELQTAADNIEKEENSPFVPSPEAVTDSSE